MFHVKQFSPRRQGLFPDIVAEVAVYCGTVLDEGGVDHGGASVGAPAFPHDLRWFYRGVVRLPKRSYQSQGQA